jgi:hypothetical protein
MTLVTNNLGILSSLLLLIPRLLLRLMGKTMPCRGWSLGNGAI